MDDKHELVTANWFKVTAPDGSTWCETSDQREAVKALRIGDRLSVQMVCAHREWRDITPDNGAIGTAEGLITAEGLMVPRMGEEIRFQWGEEWHN